MQQDLHDNFYDETNPFSSNFHLAAGLSAWWDYSAEPIEDPTYGQLKIYYYQWDFDDWSMAIYEEI